MWYFNRGEKVNKRVLHTFTLLGIPREYTQSNNAVPKASHSSRSPNCHSVSNMQSIRLVAGSRSSREVDPRCVERRQEAEEVLLGHLGGAELVKSLLSQHVHHARFELGRYLREELLKGYE